MASGDEWRVRIYLNASHDRTAARAVLEVGAGEVQASGAAVHESGDPAFDSVEEEVAAARALVALGRRMLEDATLTRHRVTRRRRHATV